MRIFAALFVLSVLLAACDSEGGQGDGRVDAGSSSTPPIGEQIPGGMGFDLGFSARADRDDAVDQPWRVPCVEGPLAADSNRSAARGLTQRGTRQTAMMWTSRTFVVYPNASVARQAVRQLTTVLLSCPSAPKRWRMDMASVGDETRRSSAGSPWPSRSGTLGGPGPQGERRRPRDQDRPDGARDLVSG